MSPKPTSASVLEGGCECGRNQYTIYVPAAASDQGDGSPQALQIRFDGSSRSLRINAPPASVFVRVPLPWLHSVTYAFYPDETHAQIRRSYTSRYDPSSKRFFCGICANLLSVWTEESASDPEYVDVNWHTLEPESRDLLDILGLLPQDHGEDGKEEVEYARSPLPAAQTALSDSERSDRQLLARTTPWFEEMLEGSPLGRLRRRRGGEISADGQTRVEWEIVEYGDFDEAGAEHASPRAGAKRKIADDDIPIHSGH